MLSHSLKLSAVKSPLGFIRAITTTEIYKHYLFFISGLKAFIVVVPALIAAGCGGANFFFPPPSALSSLPPEAVNFTGCPIVRLTPQSGVSNVYVNTQIIVTYNSPMPNQCAGLSLRDANGNNVPIQMIYSDEWASRIGGVIGATAASPVSVLQPGSQYTIFFSGNMIGAFQTGPATALRGTYVEALDENANEDNYPSSPTINAQSINNSLSNLISSYVNNNRVYTAALVAAIGADAPNLLNPNAQYSAHIKKLTYNSIQANGTPITLSGLLTYPENADGSPFDYRGAKLLMLQHGSLAITNTDPPSKASSGDLIVNLMASGKGYISFEPDLIGIGDTASTQSQAYLIAQDTATASQDMLLAVQDYFAKNFSGVQLNTNLSLAGASQGGFSVFAVLPYVSNLSNVTKVFTDEGPFNIFQTLTSGIFATNGAHLDAYSQYENLGFLPSHLLSIMNSYVAYEGFSYASSDVFQANGNLTSTFVQNYVSSMYPDLVFHTGLNSMVGSTIKYNAPNANVVLFHYSGDTLVPSQNTVDMIAFLNNGSQKLASVSRGDCHENSLFVTTFLYLDNSVEATHEVCGVFFLNQLIGDL